MAVGGRGRDAEGESKADARCRDPDGRHVAAGREGCLDGDADTGDYWKGQEGIGRRFGGAIGCPTRATIYTFP